MPTAAQTRPKKCSSMTLSLGLHGELPLYVYIMRSFEIAVSPLPGADESSARSSLSESACY